MPNHNKRYHRRIAELLAFHHILGEPDDLTKSNFDEAIMEFQAKAEIFVDGIPGPETLWELQLPWALSAPKPLLARCEADVVPGISDFASLILREDAADAYRRVREVVIDAGGVMPTAGGLRNVSAAVGRHRSAKSFHYAGLAFDLAVTAGFFEPDSDPFVISATQAGSYWNVWCRAPGADEHRLSATYWDSWDSGKDRRKRVRGRFVDFTAECARRGFRPIGPRRAFRRRRDRRYMASEWWHFQSSDLLIPGISQFGIELLRIEGYTPESIRAQSENVWANRKAVFRSAWF